MTKITQGSDTKQGLFRQQGQVAVVADDERVAARGADVIFLPQSQNGFHAAVAGGLAQGQIASPLL